MVARSDTTGIRAVDTTGADPCFAVSVLWSISAALRRHRRWPRRPSCDHRVRRLQPRCRCRFSLCQHRNDRAPDLRTRLVRLGERSLTRHALRPDYRRDLVGCTARFTLVRRAARRHFGLLPGLSAPNVPSLDWRSPLDNCSASPRLTREGSSHSAAVSIERAFLRERSAQPPGSRVIGLRFSARLAADTLCYGPACGNVTRRRLADGVRLVCPVALIAAEETADALIQARTLRPPGQVGCVDPPRMSPVQVVVRKPVMVDPARRRLTPRHMATIVSSPRLCRSR
jgi:hypothetical protein